MPVQTLLRDHRNTVLSNNVDYTYRVKVRRKHVWEDALHQFKHKILPSHHIRVTFLGEPAVDAGGPLREFFCLLMSAIGRNNSLFCGEMSSRIPTHNVLELTKNTYKYVGIMIVSSIVHGGPAPRFFAHCVADYIVFGIDHVKPKLEEVLDLVIKNKLRKVQCYT